jgi:hypothetical protein
MPIKRSTASAPPPNASIGQAVALGIERPKLRNRASIANHNTLLYVLINLYAWQRVRTQRKERAATPT